MKFKLANVWVVEYFPVRLLCDRLLLIQSGVVLGFLPQKVLSLVNWLQQGLPGVGLLLEEMTLVGLLYKSLLVQG